MKYRFSEFIVDDELVTLAVAGRPMTLNDTLIKILILLLQTAEESPGAAVGKDELLAFAWGDENYVDENNLAKAIATLRRDVFNETPARPRFIKTVPGQGYRFMGHIEVDASPEDAIETERIERRVIVTWDEMVGPDLYDCLVRLSKQDHGEFEGWTREGSRLVDKDDHPWLVDRILHAKRDISVISYSFTHSFNRYEEVLGEFLNRTNATLRVLMLDPFGPGFAIKTGLEAFKQTGRTNQHAWLSAVASTRTSHLADILSGVRFLDNLRTQYGTAKVSYSFYLDTPNLRGVMIDGKCGLFSSYFIDPVKRGNRGPTLVVDDFEKNPELKIIRRVFGQWFDVHLALGRKSLDQPPV